MKNGNETKTGRSGLARLAAFMEAEQQAVTDQWVTAVRRDVEMPASDRMTHEQLIDYLPRLYQDLCDFVRLRSPTAIEVEVKQDARQHGDYRWRQGYRLDELLRELEILRRIILASFVTRFARSKPGLRSAEEITARSLINDFFSAVTTTSVKQFMNEQQDQALSYTSKLEEANRELSQARGASEESAAARLLLSFVVAYELRNLLQSLAVAVQLLQQESANSNAAAAANSQIREMSVLLEQLLDYSVLVADRKPVTVERFELAPLHEELMAVYRPQAAAKGLSLGGDCRTAPPSIIGDRIKTKQIAANLLSNAIKHTTHGEVTLKFSTHDDDRWMLMVSDTGEGIAPVDYARLFDEFDRLSANETISDSGIGLAVTKELVSLLQGNLSIVSQLGLGSRFEVVLPRWNKATQET
jgi:signal transduction histidine kinase